MPEQVGFGLTMNFKIGKLKAAAVFMCSVIAAGSLTYVNNYDYNDIYAKTISDLEDEIDANDEEIADLEGEIADLDKDIKNAEYEQSLIEQKIALQQENLDNINTKISNIEIKLDDTNQKIDDLEEDIKNKKKDIDVQLEQFKDRLRAMYVSGNDSLASALVGSTDFFDMLSKMELISQISKYDNDLVTSLQNKLEQYEEAQSQLDIEKDNYNNDLKEQQKYKDEFTAAIQELNTEYQKSQQYADDLQAEKDSKQSDIDQYEKDSAAKQSEIDKINEIARQQAEAAREEEEEDDNYYSNDDSSSSSGGSGDGEISGSTGSGSYNGSLTWPVPGHYVISSQYEYRWGSFHQGIDISDGNTMGASIAAADSGTVTVVATGCSHNYGKDGSCGCNGGYGNYFMIDHGNGVSTFYAHCSDVYVSVGQTVSKGEIVGTVGSTGWSTGAHLHFEVRINGSTVNPTDYLY